MEKRPAGGDSLDQLLAMVNAKKAKFVGGQQSDNKETNLGAADLTRIMGKIPASVRRKRERKMKWDQPPAHPSTAAPPMAGVGLLPTPFGRNLAAPGMPPPVVPPLVAPPPLLPNLADLDPELIAACGLTPDELVALQTGGKVPELNPTQLGVNPELVKEAVKAEEALKKDPVALAKKAAEKVNKMLAEKGVPVLNKGVKKLNDGRYVEEISINESAHARQELTKHKTLHQIHTATGAIVSVKGRYVPPGQKPPEDDSALHLEVMGTSKEVVNAGKMVRHIINPPPPPPQQIKPPPMGIPGTAGLRPQPPSHALLPTPPVPRGPMQQRQLPQPPPSTAIPPHLRPANLPEQPQIGIMPGSQPPVDIKYIVQQSLPNGTSVTQPATVIQGSAPGEKIIIIQQSNPAPPAAQPPNTRSNWNAAPVKPPAPPQLPYKLPPHEIIYLGLDFPTDMMSLQKISGEGGQFLHHVAEQTLCRVEVRGDAIGQQWSGQPLYILIVQSQVGVGNLGEAKLLAEDLVIHTRVELGLRAVGERPRVGVVLKPDDHAFLDIEPPPKAENQAPVNSTTSQPVPAPNNPQNTNRLAMEPHKVPQPPHSTQPISQQATTAPQNQQPAQPSWGTQRYPAPPGPPPNQRMQPSFPQALPPQPQYISQPETQPQPPKYNPVADAQVSRKQAVPHRKQGAAIPYTYASSQPQPPPPKTASGNRPKPPPKGPTPLVSYGEDDHSEVTDAKFQPSQPPLPPQPGPPSGPSRPYWAVQ